MYRSLNPCKLIAAAFAIVAMSLPLPSRADTVLRAVPTSDLKILDPVWTTALITRNHGYMIYDTLFAEDDKGAIKPQMIDTYVVSNDGKNWRFKLRPGLKFHDGTPVTGEDVVASLARWGKRDVLGQRMMGAMDVMTATGPDSFTMSFKQPFGLVLEALGKSGPMVPFIMPKRIADTPADRQIEDLTGSGPFTLVKADFRPGDRVIYRKNAAYVPRKEPASGMAGAKEVKVDRVEWVFLRDPQTQTNALLNGEVDLLEVLPAAGYPQLQGNAKVELVDLMPSVVYTAIYNHKIKPFNDPKVVKAAMLAINQEAMLKAQTIHKEFFKTCASIYPCGSAYATGEVRSFSGKPQLDEARKLLKESTYGGEPVVVLLPSDVPTLNRLPLVYGELLKQVGFTVSVQSVDWATLLTRRAKMDASGSGAWNIFVTLWGGSDASNPMTYAPLTGNGDDGYFGWPVDSQLEALKTKFMQTGDVGERRKIAADIERRALETGVVGPIGEGKGPTAVRRGTLTGLLPASTVVYWNVDKK